MPHSISEQQLESICAQCKKPHGDSITLESYHHKVYEIIICKNCGYEIVRLRTEKAFTDQWEMSRKA
jgi:hypothetical protein